MKWWAIYTNLRVNAIVRLTHSWNEDSQSQKIFLASSADKQTRNYDIEPSKHRLFLSTLKSRGLSSRNMKWLWIYTNLPISAIVRLPHHLNGVNQGHETFLAASPDKQTCNYDTECSNYDLSLSILRSSWFSPSKMKCWTIYTNLPVNTKVRLPHPRSGDSQGQETCLVTSAGKQTRSYNTDCSKYNHFLSTLRWKGLSRSKRNWWAIYTDLPVNALSDYPILEAEITSARKCF